VRNIKTIIKSIELVDIEQLGNNWKTNKIKPHSLHNICSRVCSFPPSLPSYFIRKFSEEGDVILDPWSGKGTVPFEALRNKRVGIGNDRSPDAFVLTHAKVRPVGFYSLKKYLLVVKKKVNATDLAKDLTELDKKAKIFYSEKTFNQVRKLREVLMNDNSDEGIFIKAIILGILHGISLDSLSLRCSHSYSMSPNYVKKYARIHHLKRPSRNVFMCVLNKAKKVLEDPLPEIKGVALNDESGNIGLESESVNMILGSPPYFDVQTYAWCNWLRLWFLGYDYKEVKRNLSESGSEIKYREFMTDSIKELYRVLRYGGRCFIVVGDVKRSIKGGFKMINTAEFILPLLLKEGFDVEKIVVDKIPPQKRVMSYIKKGNGIEKERMIYLKKL
jgi:DNA modification methylase